MSAADDWAFLGAAQFGDPILVDGAPRELRCVDCAGTSFAEDRRSGEVICTGCGVVVDGSRSYLCVDSRGIPRSVLRALDEPASVRPEHLGQDAVQVGTADGPRSTAYHRPYHLREHIASYYGKDPVVPGEFILAIFDAIRDGLWRPDRQDMPTAKHNSVPRHKRKRTEDPRRPTAAHHVPLPGGGQAPPGGRPTDAEVRRIVRGLRSEDVKALCKLVGKSAADTRMGERFVQIKKNLCEWARTAMVPNYWLPEDRIEDICRDFHVLSQAFDEHLYTPGRRRTRKDDESSCGKRKRDDETSPMKRHNMLNYNFVQREIIWNHCRELYYKCQVDFFFPLPRTAKVLRKLTEMYNVLADQVGFPPSMWTEACRNGTVTPPAPWTPATSMFDWVMPLPEAPPETQMEKEEREEYHNLLLCLGEHMRRRFPTVVSWDPGNGPSPGT